MSVEYSVGESDTRPWGSWEVLAIGEGFIIKRIEVVVGGQLSLQSHQHRNEHWTILNGSADVTLDDETISVGSNDSVFIPKKSKHRITNCGKTKLIFIEIQTGRNLDEGDIERFEDAYGRT